MKNALYKPMLRVTGLILGLLSIMLIMTVTTVSAQNKRMKKSSNTPEVRAEKAVTYWNEHLQLTKDQQVKFKTLLADEFTQRDHIRSTVKDSKKRYEAFSKLRDETHKKMETILTPEQHKKFVAMRSTTRKWKAKTKKSRKSSTKMN